MTAGAREVNFEAFLNGAINYCQAGDELLQIHLDESVSWPPILNAYFVAAELALKAFLRYSGKATHSLKTVWKHDIALMHAEAIACGLVPDQADILDFRNVINLLQAGNKGQGFRYFVWEGRPMPDAIWTGKVINKLVRLVQCKTGHAPCKIGPAVKVDVVVTQPRDQDGPTQS